MRNHTNTKKEIKDCSFEMDGLVLMVKRFWNVLEKLPSASTRTPMKAVTMATQTPVMMELMVVQMEDSGSTLRSRLCMDVQQALDKEVDDGDLPRLILHRWSKETLVATEVLENVAGADGLA